MIYIGIDTGLDGGFAFTNGESAYVWPAPTVRTGKGSRRAYDVAGCRVKLAFDRPSYELYAMLEKSQAYPKQGGVSNFSTGYGLGLWEGLLVGTKIPYELVHPKTWQKHFGISGAKGDTKAQSIAVVKRLFPDMDLRKSPRCRKDHDGMADALLIAEYGRRIYGKATG